MGSILRAGRTLAWTVLMSLLLGGSLAAPASVSPGTAPDTSVRAGAVQAGPEAGPVQAGPVRPGRIHGGAGGRGLIPPGPGTAAPAGVPEPAWREIVGLLDTRRAAGLPVAKPAGDPVCNASGCSQQLGAQTVLWSAETGAHLIRTAVHAVWNTPQSKYLGFPVSSEYPYSGVFRTDFQHGSLIYVPATGRVMNVVPGVDESALVIGDSQTAPNSWVGQGLAQAGYRTILRGAGGTGYVRGNGSTGAYAPALETHQWLLPWGTPSLIILQGGGNDTAHSPAEIRSGAQRLLADVRLSYPTARIIMVGVIGDGGGPRKDVDRVLAATAAEAGVAFLSPGDWWTRYGLNGDLRPDGRHLSEAGHARVAGVFAQELTRMAPAGPTLSPDHPLHALP